MLLNVSPEAAHKELLKLSTDGRELRNTLHDAADHREVAAAGGPAATWLAVVSTAGRRLFREGQHLEQHVREFGRSDRHAAIGRIAERIAEAERLEQRGTYDRRQLEAESNRVRDEATRHLDSLLDVLARHLRDVEGRLPVRASQAQPKIFFSWQSDLPNNTNRTFIQRALEAAISQVADDGSIEIVPRLDEAAADVTGAEDLAATIQRKIEEAAVFVGDVSIIGRAGDRPTPNPNVLIETGYAMRALGPSRTILVFNDHFGRLEDLPFDLRPRLAMRYTAVASAPGLPDPDRSAARRDLANRLAKAITGILAANDDKALALRQASEEAELERERRRLELERLQRERNPRLVIKQPHPAARSGTMYMTSFDIENHGESHLVVEVHHCEAKLTESYWRYVKMRPTDATLRFATSFKTNQVVKPGDIGQLTLRITLEAVRERMLDAGLPNPSEWHWTYFDTWIVLRYQARGSHHEQRQQVR